MPPWAATGCTRVVAAAAPRPDCACLRPPQRPRHLLRRELVSSEEGEGRGVGRVGGEERPPICWAGEGQEPAGEQEKGGGARHDCGASEQKAQTSGDPRGGVASAQQGHSWTGQASLQVHRSSDAYAMNCRQCVPCSTHAGRVRRPCGGAPPAASARRPLPPPPPAPPRRQSPGRCPQTAVARCPSQGQVAAHTSCLAPALLRALDTCARTAGQPAPRLLTCTGQAERLCNY